jgi:hypothetical protein
VLAGDARRKLRLHFDNLACHTTHLVTNKMARSHCLPVLDLSCSPDLAICDCWFIERIKERLIGITAVDGNDFRNEVLPILSL